MNKLQSLFLALLLIPLPALLSAQEPVVHAVLFYSPTCPHCHKVIEEHLPPLLEKYGERLVIIGINTVIPQGREIYRAAMARFAVAEQDRGVPALVVGETLLKGSREIPQSFPALIANGLAHAGIGWPDIPGLREVLEAQGLIGPSSTAGPSAGRSPLPTVDKFSETQTMDKAFSLKMTVTQKLARDPLGNTLALAVLAGMVFSVCFVGYYYFQKNTKLTPWPRWSIPALLTIGIGVAAYLSFVEVSQVAAACGPVGDCNAVQQSSYARLFGVVSMAILGLLAYIAIGFAWALQYYGPRRWRRLGATTILGLSLSGTLFSIYLTFLEPFVIGATCLWCITSAVTMTLILWAAATSAKRT